MIFANGSYLGNGCKIFMQSSTKMTLTEEYDGWSYTETLSKQ